MIRKEVRNYVIYICMYCTTYVYTLSLVCLVMLLWFVSPVVAEAVLSWTGLIDEDQVEIIPEKVTASCLDQNI